MAVRLVVALNALIFVAVLPILEVGPTHVFNPDWPGHARLHEVWQLITNAVFAGLAIHLAWSKGKEALSLIVSLGLSGGFVIAFLTQDLYGGTMKHSDGSELLVAGVNPAFGLLSVLSMTMAIMLAVRLLGPVSRKPAP